MKPLTGEKPGVRFSIRIKKSAYKELGGVSKPDRERIIQAIDRLAEHPYAGRLLKGDMAGLRRVRVGDYRIIYEVFERQVLVLVLRVSHRRESYR